MKEISRSRAINAMCKWCIHDPKEKEGGREDKE